MDPVLIVDDDLDLASVLSDALATAGLRSVIALDGREAMDALQRQKPSVILLDLMMPGMDGWEFRKAQRARPEVASIPVIVMTASGRAEQKAHDLGASGYLDKPLSLSVLIEEVQRAARSHA
jgi:CheY-like chemotaxis protein